MIALEALQEIPAATITGLFGKPTGFGQMMFGWSQYGRYNPHTGIYQRRHVRLDQPSYAINKHKAKKSFKIAPYWPSNPRTVGQQAHRSKFADAVAHWQGLTIEQKGEYNRKAGSSRRIGYTLCLREYLLSH
jgi:hypothetical protein